MDKIKILLTGAKGQLGNELQLLAAKSKFFFFIPTDVEQLDITDKQAVIDFYYKNQFSAIVNCAAYTAVDKAETDRDNAYKINVTGTKNLTDLAKIKSLPIIHISTDYVFDGTNYKPYNEDDIINPQSYYGITKAESEKLLYDYSLGYIIRTSWLYSSYGKNFVKTVLRLSEMHSDLRIVADQIGTPTYAADLANAILVILYKIFKENFVKPGIYHFSNEGIASWYDLAKEITDYAGLQKNIIPIASSEYPTPAKRPFYSVLNKRKIKTVFDLKIPHWKDSLHKCLDLLIRKV